MKSLLNYALIGMGICLLFGTELAWAEPLSPREVPKPLQSWIDWVLKGHETASCPFFVGESDSVQCVWPGALRLQANAKGGTFAQSWQLYTRTWVDLPGDETLWPQSVRVDQREAVVLRENGRPRIWLEPGTHRIEGEFLWDQIPETIATPLATGLVDLHVEAQAIAFPTRDAEGRIWLKQRVTETPSEENRLEVIVHRQVFDEVPLQLTTRIELQVSGASREVVLGRALPDGFIPLALYTPLPTRIESDGKLRVQVRPGSWAITLEARHHGPVQKLARPAPDGPWAEGEVWVFVAQPSLRIVEIGGVESVDPQQTLLPADWRNFPAFAMKQDSQMQFTEKQRGNENPNPDQLSLLRRWWLDFDGKGFSVSDSLSGVIQRSARLEMQASTDLGRIALHGQNQLITRNGDSPQVGIEIPVGAVQVDADSRIEGSRYRISAVGWDQDFQQVSGVLQLPPGWKLFHVTGADAVSNTWIKRWTLLDLFLVMVLAMAIFRLFDAVWGGVALATFVLTFTERGAPYWTWVVLIVLIALQRVVLRGNFSKILKAAHALAFLGLASLALVFAIQQARLALHPALERPYEMVRGESSPVPASLPTQEADQAMAPAAEEPMKGKMNRLQEKVERAERKLGSYSSSSYAIPTGQVSTGPGLPNWEWNSVQISWNGPVPRTQTLHLFLLGPVCNAVLAFVRIACLFLLLVATLGVDLKPWLVRIQGILRRAPSATALMVLLVAAWSQTAAAQDAQGVEQHEIMSQSGAATNLPELFDELRRRLLERPACYPNCAEIAKLHLQVTPANFRAQLEVHSGAKTAVPFSLGIEDYALKSVELDGDAAVGVFRRGAVFWIPVTPGRHKLVIEGALPPRESIEIPFALKPHFVTAQVEGWQVHGLLKNGRVEGALQLTRIRNAKREEVFETSRLPAFVWLEREIVFDLKWSVHTRISRVTSPETPLVLEIPLLPGESVTSEQVRMREGRALVNLAPGVHSIEWDSTLEITEAFTLKAPDTDAWSEIWRLRSSPIWHVAMQGIPEIHQPSAQGEREWRPWPGEQVTLQITRPTAVSGRTVTIDRSLVRTTPGQRATEVSLDLTLRSSQGGPHSIQLPKDCELERVVIDGVEKPVQKTGDQVTLDLIPGTQTALLVWREPRGIGALFSTSSVDLGIESVNAELEIAGLEGRWPLFVGGPRLGPAVLFWPMLLVYAVLCFGLSRLSFVPLCFRQWLLLAVGLTQVHPLFALGVIAWFVALGLRKQHPTPIAAKHFNWTQFGLIALTVFALGILWVVIAKGLLGYPQMYIEGNGSTAWLLRWYQDRANALLPTAWLLSVPLMVYRFAMLAWALWLAMAMNDWLRWAWGCFSEGGAWRKGAPKVTP